MYLKKLASGPTLTKLNFEIYKERWHSQDKTNLDMTYSISPHFPDREDVPIKVVFDLKITAENSILNINLIAETFFDYEVAGEESKEDHIHKITKQAFPYIFPVIREYVADLTRKAWIPPILLPDPPENEFKILSKDEMEKASSAE